MTRAWWSRFRKLPSSAGLLLFDPSSDRLYAYNESARLLWDLLDRGLSIDEAGSRFASTYGISRQAAQRDIAAMLEHWRSLELTAGNLPTTSSNDAMEWRPLPRGGWRDEAVYTVRGKAFSLSCEAGTLCLDTAKRLFSHLETPKAIPDLRFEVRKAADGLSALLVNGSEEVRTDDPAQLIGGISQGILETVHAGVEWLAMLHGGAVSAGGKAIIFPAASGSGKTTLIAHFIAHGFSYLADDLVALSAPSGDVVPWPMPLSVKQGSWHLVSQLHEGLHEAPAFDTTRGPARMLVAQQSSWELAPVPAAAMVFPQFVASAEARLARITPFEAIERLLQDRIWLGHPMTEQRICAFLDWIERLPAYTLVHGGAASAVECLGSIA